MYNTLVICIGSNFNASCNLESARCRLVEALDLLFFADARYTTPIDWNRPCLFLNQVVVARTTQSREKTREAFKRIEKEMGRTPADKERGMVCIDIDLVCWNGAVLKPEDFCRPYVLDGLHQLKQAGIDWKGETTSL